MEVTFVKSRDGQPMATINRKICFPVRNGKQPEVGETWEVEVAGTSHNGRVDFLELIKRISSTYAVGAYLRAVIRRGIAGPPNDTHKFSFRVENLARWAMGAFNPNTLPNVYIVRVVSNNTCEIVAECCCMPPDPVFARSHKDGITYYQIENTDDTFSGAVVSFEHAALITKRNQATLNLIAGEVRARLKIVGKERAKYLAYICPVGTYRTVKFYLKSALTNAQIQEVLRICTEHAQNVVFELKQHPYTYNAPSDCSPGFGPHGTDFAGNEW